jgi:Uma2 family endonuclease
MTMVINDPRTAEELLAKRRASGADRYDEVWEGVYMMNPMPGFEHQQIVTQLAFVLCSVIDFPDGGSVLAGCNISDRREGWEQNFRSPDVAVFLQGTHAEIFDAFACGGPDLAIEVVSLHDRSHEKLEFYAKVGTRELLYVNREPWSLELYQLAEGTLHRVAEATAENGVWVTSEVVPLKWRLAAGENRPRIEAAEIDGERRWTI